MEIGLLKRLIKEQDRRIGELEKTVKSLQPASNPTIDRPPTAREIAKTIIKPASPWQNPLGWSQIREGLSRAQVEEILGKPTSVDSVLDYQTLVYKGDVAGSGTVAGTIKLTDDRVSEITPPNF
jgi:SmpA / OmlA family